MSHVCVCESNFGIVYSISALTTTAFSPKARGPGGAFPGFPPAFPSLRAAATVDEIVSTGMHLAGESSLPVMHVGRAVPLNQVLLPKDGLP